MVEESKKRIKVWTASKNSNSGMMVTEQAAYLIGSRSNFVAADSSHVSITGNGISFNTLSENQRHGGLFIKMNDLVQMVPTTLVTPMPAQVPYPPLAFVETLIDDTTTFLSMMNTVGGG